MPYYMFSWVQNAVTTYWWVESLESDADAARRADEIMDATEARSGGASQADAQMEDAGPSELPAVPGGVDWREATSEEIRITQEAKREAESVPMIPPDELIIRAYN